MAQLFEDVHLVVSNNNKDEAAATSGARGNLVSTQSGLIFDPFDNEQEGLSSLSWQWTDVSHYQVKRSRLAIRFFLLARHVSRKSFKEGEVDNLPNNPSRRKPAVATDGPALTETRDPESLTFFLPSQDALAKLQQAAKEGIQTISAPEIPNPPAAVVITPEASAAFTENNGRSGGTGVQNNANNILDFSEFEDNVSVFEEDGNDEERGRLLTKSCDRSRCRSVDRSYITKRSKLSKQSATFRGDQMLTGVGDPDKQLITERNLTPNTFSFLVFVSPMSFAF